MGNPSTGEFRSAQERWTTWARYQMPYAALAYAYFPITLTKRVLLHPRRAAHDLMVRRFWDQWGWLPAELEQYDGTKPLWIHMNSGGEVIMAQSLIRHLEAGGDPCYFSTDSYDAHGLLRQWYGPGRVAFPPWDTSLPVSRVVRRLNPKALVFVANAYFPTLLKHAKRRGVTTVLVNAVLTRNVHVANPCLRRSLALGVHRTLDAIAVQSEADYDAFRSLGVPTDRLAVTGKLEGDLSHLQLSPAERQALRGSLGLREEDRVLIAGSLPPGEIGTMLEAFSLIRASLPSSRLIIAPRWLHDVPAMVGRVREHGFRVMTRTAVAQHPTPELGRYDALVVDTFGELRTIYGAADVAFIGSSLVPINDRRGGHNPLEPLAHGVPPLFGPHMNLWRTATTQLLGAWPGLEVDSPMTLASRAVDVLTGHAPLQAIRTAGARLIQQESGAVDRTLAFLARWLEGRSCI